MASFEGSCETFHVYDESICAGYDDTDFTASEMCCACGGGDTSSTAGPFTFATSIQGAGNITCTSGFPGAAFVDDLETQGLWTGDFGTGNGVWKVNSGGTTSGNTGPSGAHSGNNYFSAPTISIIDSSGVGAAIAATVDSNNGKVNGLTITNPGSGYTNPTIRFTDPQATTFTVGEQISSPSGTTLMKGEVVKYSDSDDKIHIIHAGADDGKYHAFTVGKRIVGLKTGAGGVINLVVEDNQLSENEQNTDFSTTTDFIDFSETNPFGDASNN